MLEHNAKRYSLFITENPRTRVPGFFSICSDDLVWKIDDSDVFLLRDSQCVIYQANKCGDQIFLLFFFEYFWKNQKILFIL